ncbi:MAG: hypothetical protein ONB47_14755 [candidate division KSB1 bacterium]|nr:hypothetical protein [candidate division KSB1 bacterium]
MRSYFFYKRRNLQIFNYFVNNFVARGLWRASHTLAQGTGAIAAQKIPLFTFPHRPRLLLC